MKYFILVAVFIFGSFFIGQKLLAANTDIIINEIGAYPTSTHEWIEIWNRGADSIDIKDWKFWENSTKHNLKATTSTDSMILSGEYGVICQDADIFMLDHPNFIGSVFDSSWTSLSENSEEIGLKDEMDNFVEKFSYVSTTNFSLERRNPFLDNYSLDNWQENSVGNTVGAQNSNYSIVDINFTTTTATTTAESSSTMDMSTSSDSIFDWSFIKLNEIVSDPVEGNEQIELYNNSSSTVDLSSGLICDSSDSNCKPANGRIGGYDWLIVDLLTGGYLNNGGDSVILKDDNGAVVDRIDYSESNSLITDKGQSLIRKIDGFDTGTDSDWAVTNKITLGTANELVVPIVNLNTGGNSGGSSANDNTNGHIITSTTSTKTTKTTKTSTTTKTNIVETKDPVNISWKYDFPYGLDVGEIGIFSVKGSADPRGGEVNYFWNFGDNFSSTGYLSGHSFATSGIYLVSVTASSSAGTTGKKEFKVYVGPNFSVANANMKISGWYTTSTEDMEEYIELTNYLDKSQNISGWKIKNKSGKEYEIPVNTTIVASGTLKFFRAVHHLSFDKDGDEIILISPNDKEVYKVVLKTEKSATKETKTTSAKTTVNWLSVRGSVTVEPKTFGQQFFYVSDDDQNGFQIYQYKKDFPELKIGDYISVGGEAAIVGGVKRIRIKNKYAINVLSTNKIIEPIDLKIEDISEEMLGGLVKISGDITEIKSTLMYVDDGVTEVAVYFKKGAQINKQELKEGDKVEIIGILNQGKDGWQILPRALSDIKVVGYSDEVLASRIANDQNKQTETSKMYFTTTAGGLTALLLGFVAKARGALLMAGIKKVASLATGIIKRG
ncbi:MAG: lamin tail domain-containing protein [Candidatus Magasanikbacteria bacterium]